MTTPNHPRWTVSPRLAVTIAAGLLLAVFVLGLAAPADAATGRVRGGGGSGGGSSDSDIVYIDPIPRFTESEVRALIEKPSVTFTVDNPRITSGGEATLSWQVENADSASISGIGGVGLSGTRTVKPTAKTTYTLTATNHNGTVTKSLTVDITTLAVVGTVRIVTPAVVMLENTHYNFIDQAKGATWASSVPLSFGAAGGAKGWARVINSVRAEDNKDYQNVLQVTPENKADGFVYGEYTVDVPPNAKFRATVGFTAGHGTSDGATVSLQVRGPARPRVKPIWRQVLTKMITTDGKLDAVEADLSGWANQRVSIRLVVNGRSNANDDMVLWIAPRIIK